jgi:AcrR family transcriptional regulator
MPSSVLSCQEHCSWLWSLISTLWQTLFIPRTTARSLRARLRTDMLRQIKKLAMRQLRELGPSGISLRQIARDLDMVSSALYRYFPGRDELLTALIIDAYDAVGERAEKTFSATVDRPPRQRWLAVCDAMRSWARTHPDEYALIYGSPLPGFRAPQDTISPAARVALVLMQILGEAIDRRPDLGRDRALAPALAADLAKLRQTTFPGVPEPLLADALTAWTQLLGSISLELFGHLHNVVEEFDALFSYEMGLMADRLGL